MNCPQPLLQSLLSHDPLELCLFGAQVYILKTVVLLNRDLSLEYCKTNECTAEEQINVIDVRIIYFINRKFKTTEFILNKCL